MLSQTVLGKLVTWLLWISGLWLDCIEVLSVVACLVARLGYFAWFFFIEVLEGVPCLCNLSYIINIYDYAS